MAKAVQVQVLSRAPASNFFECFRPDAYNGGVHLTNRLLVVTLLVNVAGCVRQTPPAEPAGSPKPAFRVLGQSAPVEESYNDETIGFAVRERLNAIGAPAMAAVTVEVNDRVVTLRGVVPTLADVGRAEAAAWSAEGVKLVVNRILVVGPGPIP